MDWHSATVCTRPGGVWTAQNNSIFRNDATDAVGWAVDITPQFTTPTVCHETVGLPAG